MLAQSWCCSFCQYARLSASLLLILPHLPSARLASYAESTHHLACCCIHRSRLLSTYGVCVVSSSLLCQPTSFYYIYLQSLRCHLNIPHPPSMQRCSTQSILRPHVLPVVQPAPDVAAVHVHSCDHDCHVS